MQDANGKFTLKKREQTPMLGGQLMLPSASDSSTNVSQCVCLWPPHQISLSCLVSSHVEVPDDTART